MNRRLLIGIILIAVVVAGVLLLRNRSRDVTAPAEDAIRSTRVERGRLVLAVSATGSIVPKSETSLTFDLPAKVTDVWVEVGDFVKRGDKLAQLDDTTLASQVRQAEAALAAAQAQLDQLLAGPRPEEVAAAQANLAAAQATLEGAIANLHELQAGADENQIAATDSNLDAAQASVWLSTIQRDQATAGPSAAEIAAAEAQVASAQAQEKIARDTHDQTMRCGTVELPTGEQQEICPGLGLPEEQARFNLYAAEKALEAAQAQLDQLQAGPTQEQIDTANANVAAAVAQRDAAQAQLDALLAGTSAEQLRAAEANVAALEAQKEAAQAQLDLLLAGASEYQIATSQANVDQAQVALETAQAELAKATLHAPFDAVVTAVNVQPEQIAPATLPAVTLADTSELQIIVNVDEIDVARTSVEQGVEIVVDALPGEQIPGLVKRIAPAASQLGGVVVYPVTIVLERTDLPLRPGMSATASIVTQQLEDVLLVPNWAVRIDRDTGHSFVNLIEGDQVIEREVEIGARGQEVSQVLNGLDEGNVVGAGDVVGLRQFLDRGD